MTEGVLEYRDMFGREIKVGDYIVYAGLADRSAVLRAGRVVALTHGEGKPKVRVSSWNYFRSRGWSGEEQSGRQKDVSLGFLERLVVVPEDSVSDKIKSDLSEPVQSCW